MKLKPEENPMQDWSNLSQETQSVVDEAMGFLKQREPPAPGETQVIENWEGTLNGYRAEIQNIITRYATGKLEKQEPEHKSEYIILNDQVQLSKKHVQHLANEDLAGAQLVVNYLDSILKNFISAGPHGPGHGPLPESPDPAESQQSESGSINQAQTRLKNQW
jgi:hypothetical protein